ncbi:MAG: 3-deoxy-7-phosphoheptulonate synthase [Smithella sp.]|nr:3-deoxy-7-phosphoheptulonate synthase [Smithella sp.]
MARSKSLRRREIDFLDLTRCNKEYRKIIDRISDAIRFMSTVTGQIIVHLVALRFFFRKIRKSNTESPGNDKEQTRRLKLITPITAEVRSDYFVYSFHVWHRYR